MTLEATDTVPDAVTLYRLVWHPDHYDASGLTSSGAFPSQDLNGVRFVSVDREDLFCKEAAANIAREQQQKANGTTTFRKEAKVICLPCERVRAIFFEEQDASLEVTPEPESNNPAHCGIRNISGVKSRSQINKIRAQLMEVRIGEWNLHFD